MEITEILQVLERTRSSVRATRAMLADREPTPDRLAILADFDREIRAFEEAAAILRQVPDQGPIPPEKLREMGGEPVYIIEEGRGGHWELSENAEDYLEGRDLREYGKKWEAYLCKPSLTGWISVKERLPAEHDSVFKKFIDEGKWREGMFQTLSDDVIVAVKFADGTKRVGVTRTKDEIWTGLPIGCPVVTHWMPLPEPPEKNAEV